MHRGKVDPEASELPWGNELSRDHVNRPLVLESNCLDLIFDAPTCEKVIIVPDQNYITSPIRKFMLDMLSPGPRGVLAMFAYGGVRAMFLGLKFQT